MSLFTWELVLMSLFTWELVLMSVYLGISIDVSVYLGISIDVSVYLGISIAVSVYLGISIDVSVYLGISIDVSVCCHVRQDHVEVILLHITVPKVDIPIISFKSTKNKVKHYLDLFYSLDCGNRQHMSLTLVKQL